MLFSDRGEKVGMCHFKEIENVCKNFILNFGGTEPPFRANLLYKYAQSGFERTSFSGSAVNRRCNIPRTHALRREARGQTRAYECSRCQHTIERSEGPTQQTSQAVWPSTIYKKRKNIKYVKIYNFENSKKNNIYIYIYNFKR